MDPVTVKKKGFLGKLGLTETEFKKRDVPYLISLGNGMLTETEKKEILELRDFLDDTKAFNVRFREYQELAGEIYSIKLRVEIGLQPLEGKCSLCPKVKIINGGEKHNE